MPKREMSIAVDVKNIEAVRTLHTAAQRVYFELLDLHKALGMHEDWPPTLFEATQTLGEALWPDGSTDDEGTD